MMKYIIAVACLFAHYYGQGQIQPQPLFGDHKILVAAHRGDWRNAPENSLQAFTNAVKMGVDIVEVDLAMTRDGILVIMHDQTIDRTTNGKGSPSDYTLEELKQFRLRDGAGRLSNHRIPTLREVMELLKGKVVVNLDKSTPYFTEAFAMLKQTGTLRQAIFKSDLSYADLRQKYATLIDSIIYMPVVNLDKPLAGEKIAAYLQHMKPYAFELIFEKDSSRILFNNQFITKQYSKIWINSLWASLNAGHDDDKAVEDGNIADSWAWLISHGATILQTDRPREMIAWLEKKGWRKRQPSGIRNRPEFSHNSKQ